MSWEHAMIFGLCLMLTLCWTVLSREIANGDVKRSHIAVFCVMFTIISFSSVAAKVLVWMFGGEW